MAIPLYVGGIIQISHTCAWGDKWGTVHYKSIYHICTSLKIHLKVILSARNPCSSPYLVFLRDGFRVGNYFLARKSTGGEPEFCYFEDRLILGGSPT